MDTSSIQARVLLLEYNARDADLIEQALTKEGLTFITKRVASRSAFTETLHTFHPDIVLATSDSPEFDIPGALELTRQYSTHLPVIAISGTMTDVAAANLIRAGACDYILKDRLARLGAAVRRALAERESQRSQLETEALFRESEAKFRALVESTADVIWEMDRSGRFSYVSPQVKALVGYEPSEMIGKSPADFMRPDEYEQWKTMIESSCAAHTHFHLIECVQQHKLGHTVYVEVNGTDFVDESGQFAGYRGVTRDITERKKLLAEREQMARIVDSAQDAIMVKDLNNTFTSWNGGAERMFGYTAAEVIGKPISLIAPDHLKNEGTELTDRVLRGETVVNYPTFRRRKDGTLVDVLFTYSLVKGANGATVGVSGIAKDVTKQRQAERELALQSATLKTEHELSPDGILVVDLAGRVVSYNERFLNMWGLPPHLAADGIDQALLAAATELVADPDAFLARIRHLYAHADEEGFEEIILKNGKIFQRYTASTRDKDGTYLGRVWFFRDVTARRGIEKQLHESLDATVGVIANMVEARDPYTAGHQRRVAKLALAIAARLGMSAHDMEGLRVAGILHDLGKIHIPAEILSKPGKLSPAEYELLKTHPEAGYDILKGVQFPWPIAEIIRQHHERMDGGGYPRGLKGEKILIEARIIAAADVVEAMMSHRPYRPGLGIDRALAELERGQGQVFDAAVVAACLKVIREDQFTFE